MWTCCNSTNDNQTKTISWYKHVKYVHHTYKVPAVPLSGSWPGKPTPTAPVFLHVPPAYPGRVMTPRPRPPALFSTLALSAECHLFQTSRTETGQEPEEIRRLTVPPANERLQACQVTVAAVLNAVHIIGYCWFNIVFLNVQVYSAALVKFLAVSMWHYIAHIYTDIVYIESNMPFSALKWITHFTKLFR